VAELGQEVTVDKVNQALRVAAETTLEGILQYCDEELVSVDFNGNPHSSIFDSGLTKILDGNFVKCLSWYDNEWGFSNRMVDVAKFIGKNLSSRS